MKEGKRDLSTGNGCKESESQAAAPAAKAKQTGSGKKREKRERQENEGQEMIERKAVAFEKIDVP